MFICFFCHLHLFKAFQDRLIHNCKHLWLWSAPAIKESTLSLESIFTELPSYYYKIPSQNLQKDTCLGWGANECGGQGEHNNTESTVSCFLILNNSSNSTFHPSAHQALLSPPINSLKGPFLLLPSFVAFSPLAFSLPFFPKTSVALLSVTH